MTTDHSLYLLYKRTDTADSHNLILICFEVELSYLLSSPNTNARLLIAKIRVKSVNRSSAGDLAVFPAKQQFTSKICLFR